MGKINKFKQKVSPVEAMFISNHSDLLEAGLWASTKGGKYSIEGDILNIEMNFLPAKVKVGQYLVMSDEGGDFFFWVYNKESFEASYGRVN